MLGRSPIKVSPRLSRALVVLAILLISSAGYWAARPGYARADAARAIPIAAAHGQPAGEASQAAGPAASPESPALAEPNQPSIVPRSETPGPFLSWPVANTDQHNITRLPDTNWTRAFLGITACGEYPSLVDPGTWFDGKSYPGNRNLILPGVPDSRVKWMNYGKGGPMGNAFNCYRGHEGIDISQPDGTHILAAASGYIYYRTGSRYTIQHPNVNGSGQTWYTTYESSTNWRYPNGTWVDRGQWIADVTGGHVHLEALYNGIYSGNARNPYGIDSAPFTGCLFLDPQFCPTPPDASLPVNRELMRNGSFETFTLDSWWSWGDIAYAFYDSSILFFKHNAGGSGGSVGQSFYYSVPTNTPFELRLKLANTSNVTKTPLVSIVSGNSWDVQCRFTLGAGENSLREYIVRGVNHSPWNEFNIQISPDPIDGIPDLVMDDVSLKVLPDAGITQTECIDPAAPDSTPPGGQVTYPSDGMEITSGPIALAADAWDNAGGSGVKTVEFHVFYDGDWHQVGTDSSAPFGVEWNLPPSLHTQELIFTIHVIDNAGNEAMDPGGYRRVRYRSGSQGPLAAQIDAYLAGKNSPLAGAGSSFDAWGQTHNVDPRLMVAIAGAESTFGRSGDCATQRHNAWGYGGGWPSCLNFLTWDSGIARTTWQIWEYRTNRGLTTIHAIGQTWCGSGCSNWEPNVRTFYAELGGDPDSNNLVYPVTVDYGLAHSPWPMARGNLRSTGQSPMPGPGIPRLAWSLGIPEDDYGSAPVIGGDGTLYLTMGKKVFAVGADGQVKWNYEAPEYFSWWSGAVAADGLVVMGNHNGTLYALLGNGTLAWSYPTGSWISGSPAIASDGTIYFGSSAGQLIALRHDGSLKWAYTANTWVHSPSVGPDGTIYFGGTDGGIYGINSNGTLKWKYATQGFVDTTPVVGNDGNVYAGSRDGGLYAVRSSDGSLAWKYQTSGAVTWSSVALGSNGTLYFASEDVDTENGYEDAFLYALAPDGSLQWREAFEINANASPVVGADGTVYACADDGYLYAFTPGGAQKWRLAVDAGRWLRNNPVIGSDNMIYLTAWWPAKLYAVAPVARSELGHALYVPLVVR